MRTGDMWFGPRGGRIPPEPPPTLPPFLDAPALLLPYPLLEELVATSAAVNTKFAVLAAACCSVVLPKGMFAAPAAEVDPFDDIGDCRIDMVELGLGPACPVLSDGHVCRNVRGWGCSLRWPIANSQRRWV